MSRMINLGVLGLKAFTGLWALITFAVAAALQSKFFGTSDSVGGIIAAGVLTMLWIIISLVLQFVMRETIIISVMVDTIVYGILFVLALGGTAAESRNADIYRYYSRFSEAKLGNATIGLGWILVFLLLAVLVFQVFYTLRNHGGSKQTWFTPFHVLLADGTSRVTGGRNAGIGHTATPTGHNHSMTQTVPQAELGTLNHQTVPHNQAPLGPAAVQQV